MSKLARVIPLDSLKCLLFFYSVLGPFWVSASDLTTKIQTRVDPSLRITFDEASLRQLKARYPLGKSFKLIQGRNNRPAAQFFGVDAPSLIQIPHRSELEFNEAMTIDVWVRTDSRAGGDAFGKREEVGSQVLLAKSHEKNGFQLLIGNHPTHTGALVGSFDDTWTHVSCVQVNVWPQIPVGVWYRLSLVVDSRSGLRFYIDKSLILQCLNSRPSFAAANQEDLFIGQLKGGWYPFYGTVQDLHFYRVALDDAQIKALEE